MTARLHPRAWSCIYMCGVHSSVCAMLSRNWCLSRGLCFPGSEVSQGEELSTWLICAAGNSAQAETPTHVKCHSTNFFPMQPRYHRRGERQTHLIAPQNEIPGRLCNSQICRIYFNGILSILSLLFCTPLYADFRIYFFFSGQHTSCNTAIFQP